MVLAVPLFVLQLVLLTPPIMLFLVLLLGQCGLWYYVHCRIARSIIPLFVLYSYLDRELLYPACLGVWSVCRGLTFAFFGLSSSSLMPWSCLVWSLYISWCPLVRYFRWSAHFCLLYSLFIAAIFLNVPSFRHQGSCWWRYPRFMKLLLTRFVGSRLWWFTSWCRCCLVLLVSRNGFSIRVGIRSFLILFIIQEISCICGKQN